MEKGSQEITRVLSFGAGVQSTTLLLMYYYGDLQPQIDFAVFADTQSEPSHIYEHLDKMITLVKDKIEIIVTSKGNLVEDSLGPNRSASIPFFIKNEETGKEGMVMRQCTQEYKIDPVRRAIRQKLGYKKGQRVKDVVHLMMGISTDESIRMRVSNVKWIINKYPLILEKRVSRSGCSRYLHSKGFSDIPKSSCYMCPFHSNEEWRYLQEKQPKAFLSAVEYDKSIRNHKVIKSQAFLHRSLIPLDEIDFSEDNHGQMDLFTFQGECTGYCGS